MCDMENIQRSFTRSSQSSRRALEDQAQTTQLSSTPVGLRYLYEALQNDYTKSTSSSGENNSSYASLHGAHSHFSALLNVNDPVSMHLLIETAISETTTYEILSYEEVDELKNEHTLLVGRISDWKQKLLLESKVRDAAMSLSRLYSPKTKSKQIGSPTETSTNNNVNNASMGDIVKQANDELNISTRRCEELVLDIWRISSRVAHVQRRLLQHNAGVLGLTHHVNHRITSNDQLSGNRPSNGSVINRKSDGSPLTIAVYAPDEFDERSFYKGPENLDEVTNSIVADRKYYGLAVHDSIDMSLETYKHCNGCSIRAVSSQNPSSGKHSSSVGSVSSSDILAPAFIERRVLELNSRIKEFLAQSGVQISTLPTQPQAIVIPQVGLNGERSSISDPLSHPAAGETLASALEEQLNVLEQGIEDIEKTAQVSSSQKVDVTKRLERTETILGSLWEVLLAGEEELQHQKLERQRRRDKRSDPSDEYTKSLEHGDETDEDNDFAETDGEDEVIPVHGNIDRDNFSISAFSGKVHSLYERATRLHSERTLLRKHLVRQQGMYTDQMKSLRQEHDKTVVELTATKTREVERKRDAQGVQNISDELKSMTQKLKDAEDQLEELELKLREAEGQIQRVTEHADQQMEQANSRNASLEASLTETSSLSKTLQEELQEKDEMIALLQGIVTELEEKLQHQKIHLEGMPDEMEIERLQNDSKDHNSTKDKLRQSEDKLKLTQSLNHELEVQLHDLSTNHRNLGDLQDHIARLENQRQAHEKESMDKDGKMGSLESIIAQNEARLESLERVHVEHQAVKDDLEHTRDQLKEHLNNATLLRERDDTIVMLQKVIGELEEKASEHEQFVIESQKHNQPNDQHLQQIARLEQEMELLRTQTGNDKARLVRDSRQNSDQVTHSEIDLRSLESEVARLSTEVAVLQAELDETHSASRQRIAEVRRQAAEAAQAEAGRPQAAMDLNLLNELEELSRQNQNLLAQIRKLKEERHIANNNHRTESREETETTSREQILKQRCDELQRELNEMLFDYETVTKTSIEFEAERVKLEDMIDLLRVRVEGLETNLADERVRWLGIGIINNNQTGNPSSGSNGPLTPGAGGESTSTTVLKNEFKKMMRDMRSEQTKQIRSEQDTRRKLESELRQLRKDHQQLLKQQQMTMIET